MREIKVTDIIAKNENNIKKGKKGMIDDAHKLQVKIHEWRDEIKELDSKEARLLEQIEANYKEISDIKAEYYLLMGYEQAHEEAKNATGDA